MTSIVIASPAAITEELAPQQTEAQGFLAELKEFKINTQEDLDTANELAGVVKAKWETLESRRTAITKPLNDALNATNAQFQPNLKVLKECEFVLKNKIAVGLKYLRELQTKALQQTAQLTRQGNLVEARNTLMAAPAAKTPDNITVRQKLVYEIVDLAAVENKFLKVVLNTDMVEAAIQAGVREISGLKIFTEDAVIRRKT